ncbi:hypothetical protein BU23DRAFT_99687 [Bimuria novae-zelandiae CBS 107.79]|uniref:Uncharacterized protein n=1 Tax=Bimuria novae-zelandiae CBS 107.79 TaxID=1447943 RepID=A0A6A5VRU6_9PLEO|nr:hypothetical protein BU23DRAFT_99687 [Bimuria novae-zelandiae CBS 107.79]
MQSSTRSAPAQLSPIPRSSGLDSSSVSYLLIPNSPTSSVPSPYISSHCLGVEHTTHANHSPSEALQPCAQHTSTISVCSTRLIKPPPSSSGREDATCAE